MPEQPRPHALVFVVAASLSLLSLALREGMGGQVADQPMLMLFMFPIIFSALLGGVWPGLLSTALVSAGGCGWRLRRWAACSLTARTMPSSGGF